MSKSVFLPNYTIGQDAYEKISEICKPYGSKIVFIGGKTALSKAEKLIKHNLSSHFEVIETLWFGGEVTYENVENLKKHPSIQVADMIFAIGGGKAIDTCKVLSNMIDKALFTFPTIAATCAAITCVCAVYDSNNVFKELYAKKYPAEHAFINTKIITEAPEIYLWAGIGDTLAKGYEPAFSADGQDIDHLNSVGITLSKLCQEPLVKYGEQALLACQKEEVNKAFEEVVLAIIITTGLVSNCVINDYNSAIAHAMCYGFTTNEKVEKNHLHGEIVAYGVLIQLVIDEKFDELAKLLAFYETIKLPTRLQDLDISIEEMDEVFAKAASVNDIKVARIIADEQLLRDATIVLEKIVKG